MASAFKTVAIFAKTRSDENRAGIVAAMYHLLALVRQAGLTVLIDQETRHALELNDDPGHTREQISQQADLAIVLGGDGTMLSIARDIASCNIPLIGINFGRLGFMTDIPLNQMPELLKPMLHGEFETDRRTLLEGDVIQGGKVILKAHALNDIVVSHGVAGGLVEFTVRVDGAVMSTQRADGLIVATPTGSTAYALSANGPILHPSLNGIVLVPVAPHSLSNRPITLPDHLEVEIELTEVRDASAYFDMQSFARLQPGDIIRIRRSPHVATLLHPRGYSYFATLRQKLHWNVPSGDGHPRA
jgi:NAD+ kinase